MSKHDDEAVPPRMNRKEYEKELHKLQTKLCLLQDWVVHAGLRVIVVFEGRDAAGKGGTIKAIMERVSPRVFRQVALPSPSDREKTQLYAQRYIQHFPAAGEIVIFDRSWYNRAGVEYVMGFCSKRQYEEFVENCPKFEAHITHAGILLIKFWLEVGQEEQQRRFEARIEDPLRQWKLSPMDLESYARWYAYSQARYDAGCDRHRGGAVAHRSLRRQAAGAAELHFPSTQAGSLEGSGPRQGQASQAVHERRVRRHSQSGSAEVRT